MNLDAWKKMAAEAALEFVETDSIIGVGTGSTTNYFIDALARVAPRVEGAVPSSTATADRLRRRGIRVVELTEVAALRLYVDGADEADPVRRLIKGGGGALTREKIVAAASECFVCVVDETKLVERLGAFPLPIEVVPFARRWVADRMRDLGGRPVERREFVTDNHNMILDVHDLRIDDPLELEQQLNQLPGVVSNGLFCRRPADRLLVGGAAGVRSI